MACFQRRSVRRSLRRTMCSARSRRASVPGQSFRPGFGYSAATARRYSHWSRSQYSSDVLSIPFLRLAVVSSCVKPENVLFQQVWSGGPGTSRLKQLASLDPLVDFLLTEKPDAAARKTDPKPQAQCNGCGDLSAHRRDLVFRCHGAIVYCELKQQRGEQEQHFYPK